MSEEVEDDESTTMWDRMWFIPLLFLAMLVGFRFAEPVGDGDLFWQMAYGRQLLERHTLIPDHTLYSWTDAHNDTIYCAWIAEIFFYLLYQIGGLNIIFAFRYLMIIGVLLLAISYARQVGLARRPEFWLGLTVFTLASYVGTIIKPELFSFGYMSALAWLLYRFKLADRRSESTTRYLVALPILSCLWANSHGVYVFGMVGIGLFTAGEVLNYLISRPIALSPQNLKRLLVTAVLCGVAMCITPYFLKYPMDQVNELLGISSGGQSKGDKAAYASIAAHMTIFQSKAFHFHEYLYLMGGAAAALVLWRLLSNRRAKLDFNYILVNLVLGLIYVWYLRTTFYWPAFFLYSTLYSVYLLRQEESDDDDDDWSPSVRPALGLASWLILMGLCLRGTYEALYRPYASSWCGFGITYWNPVKEAEFIEKYHPNADKIYNDYDSGGWLIWKFYPKMKVMIDPRSFPYRHFYNDYINYERGMVSIDDMHKHWKEKPEVAIASLKNTQLWRAFLRHPDWVPAWVGPSSVVFCRRGHQYPKDAAEFEANRFEELNNSQKAMQIFQFGIESQLFDYSWAILDVMRRKFKAPEDQILIKNLDLYKQSMMSLSKQDYAAALETQEQCRHIGLFYNDGLLQRLYAYQVSVLEKAGKRPTDPEMAQLLRRRDRHAQGLDPTQ